MQQPLTARQAPEKEISVTQRAQSLELMARFFLTLRAEALSGLGHSGNLARTALNPHLAEGLATDRLPSWSRSEEGKLLYRNAVPSNLLLGFIDDSRRELVLATKDHPAHEMSTAQRLFAMADFAEELDHRMKITPDVIERFKKIPDAKKHGDYYRSVLSHGDTPRSPLSDTDWKALIDDTLKAVRDVKQFLDVELHVIAARHTKIAPDDADAQNIAGALATAVRCLPDDRRRFFQEIARMSHDADLVAQLRYWSAAEQSRAELGNSTPDRYIELLERAAHAMDSRGLRRFDVVEDLAGLRLAAA